MDKAQEKHKYSINIDTLPQYRVQLTTMDRKRPSVVFLHLKTYIKGEKSYDDVLRQVRKNVRQYLAKNCFTSRNIIGINLAEDDLNDAFHFAEMEIYLKQVDNLPLKPLYQLAEEDIKRFILELTLSLEDEGFALRKP